MSEIRVNFGNAQARASEISGSVSGLSGRSLSPTDNQTTLTANQMSKDVFDAAQEGISSFSHAVVQAGRVIHSVSGSFRLADRLRGGSNRRNGR